MYRKVVAIALLAALLLVVVGCTGQANQETSAQPPAEAGGTEPESKPNAEELYAKITTDMGYDEVMAVMEEHKPFLKNEGAINTPTGQITTNNVSWKLGKSVITVIFQDKVVIGKDLSTTP